MIDISYGSKLHDSLRDAVRLRVESAINMASMKYQDWRDAEDLYASYVTETDEEKSRREARKSGQWTYSTIYVPYSYASLMAAFTYLSAVFLSRSPILQYTARHGEGHQKVQAVEALIDYQIQIGRNIPILYFWLLDMLKYGVGVIGAYWARDYHMHVSTVEEPVEVAGIPMAEKTVKRVRRERITSYEGNRLYNIRPYDFLVDPSVSFVSYQDGEFCGVITHVPLYELRRREADGEYVNVDEAERAMGNIWRREPGSPRELLPAWASQWSDAFFSVSAEERRRRKLVRIVELFVRLSPRDWGLGRSAYPEKWVFVMAEDEVILQAKPMEERHGQFPYLIMAYEPNAYSAYPRGLMDFLRPLNDTLTWLFNARMYNVRKSLNDQFVVDPSRVNLKDLLEGGPGKLIRLNPRFYGTDVRTVVAQLPVIDSTRGHLKDAQIVMELMQRVSGASDNMMGVYYPGGRKTATEVRASADFGISRLKTLAEVNSALGWAPLAIMMLQNTQQYYDEVKKLKIAGDLLSGDPQFIEVAPEDIAGFYDFVPVDGTLPVDRMAQSALWNQILATVLSNPLLARFYDIPGIFSWTAQLAGLKNITQFRVPNVVPVPDETLMNEVKRGNLTRASSGAPLAPESVGAVV